MPEDLAGLLAVARVVPPLSGPLLAALLRLCHPRAGSTAAARDLARLGRCRLPPLALASALAAPDAATLAARLHAAAGVARPAAAASGAPAGPKLAEVHGLDPLRPRLLAMVRDLGRWAAGELPWAEMTASALLSGPPGTGKTMIARALAAEAGVPLIATSYADCQKAGHQGDMLAALLSLATDVVARTSP